MCLVLTSKLYSALAAAVANILCTRTLSVAAPPFSVRARSFCGAPALTSWTSVFGAMGYGRWAMYIQRSPFPGSTHAHRVLSIPAPVPVPATLFLSVCVWARMQFSSHSVCACACVHACGRPRCPFHFPGSFHYHYSLRTNPTRVRRK
jgi:hypothetical protein